MAVRNSLLQLADSVCIGILGLNRSCVGASTSGLQRLPGWATWHSERTLITSGADHYTYRLQRRESNELPVSAQEAGCVSAPLHGSIAVRGFKSNKRSMKPLNTTASWQALKPLLSEQQQHAQLQGAPPPVRPRWRPRLGPIVDTCLPTIPQIPLPSEYRRIGTIAGHYSLKPERVFGVIQIAGTQFKVTTDDIIFVNQLPGVEVNDVLSLERVMLLGSRAQTIVGRPFIPGGVVLAAVEEHFRDGKVHVFKKKRRKRYRRYQGPRPNMTTLRILQVRGIEPAAGDELALVPELPVQLADPRFANLLGLPSGQRLRLAPDEEDEEEDEEEQRQEQLVAVPSGQ